MTSQTSMTTVLEDKKIYRCNTILSILYDERIEFVSEEEKHRCNTVQ